MKFLCDRCKTRYSIADERVRGKILKIRCKNCSNVISVREGMPEPDVEAPAVAEARRQVRPTDFTPSVMAASPLQAAFAQAMQKPAPPPSQLEEEWYVSIDGDQSGPFTLTEAQAWVGGKKGDDELFCWCEGFDDWLPVEKVSHFRGLRTPKPKAKATTGAVPTVGSGPPRPPPARPVEDEPKPLFAAALAALEADVAADKAAAAGNGARADTEAEKPKAPVPAEAPPRQRPATSLPPPRPVTPSPMLAAAPAVAARPPVPAAKPVRAKPASGGIGLFDQSESEALDAAPAAAARPMFEPTPFEPPAAPEPIKPSNGGSKPTVSLADLQPAGDVGDAPGFDDDDDLQIGEVSRVVNMKDLLKGGRSNKSGRTAAAPASALGRGSEAVQAFADAAAPSSALAHAASASLRDDVHPDDAPAGDAAPLKPVARPARKSHTPLFVAGGVLLVALVGLVIFLAAGSGDDAGGGNVGGSGGDVEDLALTIDDPRYPRRGKTGSAAVPDPVGTGRTGTGRTGTGRTGTGKTGSGTGTNQVTGSGTGTGTGTGKTEVVMGPDGPLEPLTPDDVITQAMKMSTGTQRCYSRALKDDPFLKVKSIAAMITVSRDGKVTDVSLDSMQTTVLGQCLGAAIKRWPFRKSTEGINTKITLKFEQSGF